MHERLIVRAPDKMMDYHDGCILFAFRESIIYFRADKYGVERTDDPDWRANSFPSNCSAKSEDPHFIEIEMQEDEICYLSLDKSYKIICL